MSGDVTLPAVEDGGDREGGRANHPEATFTVPSQRLDRYTILERLGAGATGIVLAAYDPRLDRKIALKVLSGEAEAALVEARALARLAHANVVSVHDAGVSDGHAYVAMEFVDGPTLAAWLDNDAAGPGRWKTVLPVLIGAGRGLAAAHAAGIVHRDFKPANVLVKDDAIGMVVDFGLAATVDVGSASGSDTGSGTKAKTGRLRVVGTPAYMAPEVFDGALADARADQFGFCVTAYEALYGRRPFAGKSAFTIMHAVTRHELVTETDGGGVPPRVRAAILKGLSRDPDERWPSMDALLDALVEAMHGRRRRAVALALGGGVLVAGGLVTGALLADPKADCDAAGDAVLDAWSPDVHLRVAAAFAAVDEPWGDATRHTVSATLDRYADGWADARVAACQDYERGLISDELLDRRGACLQRRLVALSALTELLQEADRALALASVDVARSLPAVEDCAHTEALLATSLPPPADANEVERIRSELARAAAERIAGKRDVSQRRTEVAIEQARATEYTPVLLEALLEHARALRPEVDATTVPLAEAWALAIRTGDDVTAAEVATLRAMRFIAVHQPGPEADDDLRTAIAFTERLEAQGIERAEVMRDAVRRVEGFVALRRGDREGALAIFEDLLRRARDRSGDEHPETLEVEHALAIAAQAGGADFERAATLFAHELSVLERDLGVDHPKTAGSRGNLGLMLRHLDRYDEAIAALRQTLATYEGLPGYDDDRRRVHANLAESLYAAGRHADALPHYAAAEMTEPPTSPPTLGDLPRLLHYAQALVRTWAASRKDPELLARAHRVLDHARWGGAEAQHAVYETDALVLLAQLAIETGEYERGVQLATEARATFPGDVESLLGFSTVLTLADARWHRDGEGDRAAAHAIVLEARARLESVHDPSPAVQDLLPQIERWLEDPSGPPPCPSPVG